MEAVGSINHLCPLISGRSGSQTGNNTAHRGMAVDNIVTLPVKKLFQLLIGIQVSLLQRTAHKGHYIVMVTKRDHALVGIIVIVIGSYVYLPALIMEPFDKRLVKHINMQTDNRCNK